MKEVVHVHDPVYHKPQNIPVTKELKLSVGSAHATYQARLQEEKLALDKKQEDARRMKNEADQIENDKAKLLKTKQSLCKCDEGLAQKDIMARVNVATIMLAEPSESKSWSN